MKQKIIKSLSCVKSLGRVYTGGQALWCRGQIFSLVEGVLNIVEGGEVRSVVEEEEDPVLCFTLSPDQDSSSTASLVTSHKSGLMRIWSHDKSSDSGPSLVRTFRSIHSGSVTLMRLERLGESSVLATGGSDGSVKVWDLSSQYYTHNLRSPNTLVTTLTFNPTKLLLYVGHASGALACWDLTQSQLLHNMEAHFSAVTAFALDPDTSRAVSAGRDAVCVVWDLTTHTKLSTVPVFSPVEGMVMLEGSKRVLLAVEEKLTVWRLEGGASQMSEMRVGSKVTSLGPGEDSQVVHLTTSDRNLLTVRLREDKMEVEDTVVGDNDQVLSLSLLGEKHLAVACNSAAVRLYDLTTWQCGLFPGHTDTVLSVAGQGSRLVTSGKDNTVRLWSLTSHGQLETVATGSGHTLSVGGVAWAGDNIVSVSADRTLKLWSVTEGGLVSVRTEIAHDKDINCVAVSPDGGLLVTGGQDKLAKLWTSKELGLVSVLRGHSRGVWCAMFSPEDRLVATGSGDATVRLWSITETGASCVRQLQGHEASVLSLAWVSGQHLVTGSSDGLIKVWWVSRQECTATLDMGETKVWCLAVDGERVLAGGEGGRLQVWRDDTSEQEASKQGEEDRLVVQHQRLSNLIQEKKWTEAVKLALTLSQPLTALRLIKKLSISDLSSAVTALDSPGLDQLLGYIVQWNTNTRHSTAAQNILHNIITNISPDRLLKLPNIQSHVEGLLPYTEKHYARLQTLNTKTKFIPYLLHQMKATHLPAAT